MGGTFYVGWLQLNAVKMNLGLDKNRISNDRMFYNVGDAWQQTQVQGSWMIRPVMMSALDPFAGLPETTSPELVLFPNPAADEVRLRSTGEAPATVELLDATGRRVVVERYLPEGIVSLAGLAGGVYIVRALDPHGRSIAQERLVVQRR